MTEIAIVCLFVPILGGAYMICIGLWDVAAAIREANATKMEQCIKRFEETPNDS